jgi:hypothetical protein
MAKKTYEEMFNIPGCKGMTVIKNINNNKHWWGCGKKGTLIQCWWECILVQLPWKTVWRLLKKLKIELLYDPTIPLLGYIWRNVSLVTIKAPAHPCLLQYYSQ